MSRWKYETIRIEPAVDVIPLRVTDASLSRDLVTVSSGGSVAIAADITLAEAVYVIQRLCESWWENQPKPPD